MDGPERALPRCAACGRSDVPAETDACPEGSRRDGLEGHEEASVKAILADQPASASAARAKAHRQTGSPTVAMKAAERYEDETRAPRSVTTVQDLAREADGYDRRVR